MKNWFKIIALATSLFFVNTTPVQAEEVELDRVAAIVNGGVVF